jgi:hypothetical protein
MKQNHLLSIGVAEFKDRSPPYSSFDPRLKLRAEKKQERAAERAAKHRAYMREKRADTWANLGSRRQIGTRGPEIWAKTASAGIDFIGTF